MTSNLSRSPDFGHPLLDLSYLPCPYCSGMLLRGKCANDPLCAERTWNVREETNRQLEALDAAIARGINQSIYR